MKSIAVAPEMGLSSSRRGLAARLLAGAAAGLLTACAWTPVEPYKGGAPRTETVYLAAFGWHTEIGLRAETITGPLAALEREFPGAGYFTFGWGERGYYMATDPSVAGSVAPATALTPRASSMARSVPTTSPTPAIPGQRRRSASRAFR